MCKSKNRELVDYCFQHKEKLQKLGKLAMCRKFLGKRRRRVKQKRRSLGPKRRRVKHKRGSLVPKRRRMRLKRGKNARLSPNKKKSKTGASAYPPWYGRCNRPLPVNTNQKNHCGGTHTLKHPLTFISYQEVVEQHLTKGRGEENWCCFKIVQSRNECSLACDNEANKNQLLPQL